MSELLDGLLLRIIFSIFFCLMLLLYKYVHYLLYSSARTQLLKRFSPSINPAASLHLFARILGIGIIFTGISLNNSLTFHHLLFDIFFMGSINIVLFIISIYIMESVILYNFDYINEVIKNNNICYSSITFAITISLAMIVRSANIMANGKLLYLLVFWLLALVLFGIASKLYRHTSIAKFNQYLVQKNISLALSFGGFMLGSSLIVIAIINQEYSIFWKYFVLVIMKTLLALIIYPIFKKGINLVFSLKEKQQQRNNNNELNIGYGIYEGSTFLTACFFTAIVVEPNKIWMLSSIF